MNSKQTKSDDDQNAGDERNKGFGGRRHVVDHGPGFDYGDKKRKPETGGNHAFRRSEQRTFLRGLLLIESRSPEKEISYVNRPI